MLPISIFLSPKTKGEESHREGHWPEEHVYLLNQASVLYLNLLLQEAAAELRVLASRVGA